MCVCVCLYLSLSLFSHLDGDIVANLQLSLCVHLTNVKDVASLRSHQIKARFMTALIASICRVFKCVQISWHIMAYLYRQILSITITYSQQHEIISYSQISAASAPRSIFLSIVHGELDTIARHCGLAAESKQGITNDYDGCRNAVGYIHYIDTPLRQSCRNIMKYPE